LVGDGDVRVGIHLKREEILIHRFGLGGVALQSIGAGELQAYQSHQRLGISILVLR